MHTNLNRPRITAGNLLDETDFDQLIGLGQPHQSNRVAPLDVGKAHAHASRAANHPIDYSMHTSEVAEEAHRDRRDTSGPRLGMVLLMLSACIVIGVPLLAWLARR